MLIANVLAPLIDAEEWLLEALHSVGLGWGLAIVGLTVCVRLCTVPLVVRQFRSARELREHMPELKRLQQRFKNDKPRLQREMQAYYKEHGVNPLASFAPLLVQLPIFFSLYFLMRSDAKAGDFGTDGFLFIPNLTAHPTGSVLVGLITCYLVSQVSGSLIATRKMKGGQRGLMLAMPMLFVGIVARFPAGLAVYWITTSLWTLGQQLVLWRVAPDVPLSGSPMADAATDSASAARPAERARAGSAAGTVGQPTQSRRRQSRKRKRAHGRRR